MKEKLGVWGVCALVMIVLLAVGAVEAADRNAVPPRTESAGVAAEAGAFHGGAAERTKNLKTEAGKIGPLLYDLYLEQTRTPEDETVLKSADQLSPAPVPVENGLVLIDAIAGGDAQHLLADLEAMGLQGGSSYGRVVSGWIPVDRLAELNAMGNLVSAVPSLNSQNVGLVTTQGDVAQASDVARSTFGVDGAGVTVGTLSDSFDCTGAGGGAAADVGSGDLPPGIVVLADLAGGCTDEGRAMMQLIHDVAPGSSQAFHTAFGGTAGFANGIKALQQIAGADIIVDDVIYFAEPMFQDGPIAQAAQFVADNGSAYFSSAGNQSFNSWETFDGFVGSGIAAPFGGELHDFDPGPGVDTFQEFVLRPGVTRWSFQWDQPYASAGSATGSASDMDVYIFVNGSFVGLGGLANNIGGDPVEVFGVGLGGSTPLTIQIAIARYSGPDPGVMKYVTFGASDQRFGGGPIEYATNSSTSYGHSNAANMAGVGAAAFFNTSAFNPGVCEPACVNSFSSLGGVPILFDPADNPINEVRQRPNFVGPDGGNTTFFGADLTFPVPGTDEPDGFGNFFGTSASAPHAAAAAALMKETNPSLSPGEIYSILEGTATDMVPVGSNINPGAGPGFDFRTGYGFINIDLAVDAAATDPGNPNKRFVCHKNRTTISISQDAVPAHLAHGDKFGPCE